MNTTHNEPMIVARKSNDHRFFCCRISMPRQSRLRADASKAGGHHAVGRLAPLHGGNTCTFPGRETGSRFPLTLTVVIAIGGTVV